jgi:UDP-N-acetylglucosamine--N-acetylmuramyl-(pentapeptide) pyrophosphoryl-undecaprenol N-acetylglucosamine transferase
MTEAGAALALEDHELTPERLRKTVGDLFAAPDRLAAMAEASSSLARPDAAARIAAELLGAIGQASAA